MSDLSRILRGDRTGLMRAVVNLLRDFLLNQLRGGHSPSERDALLSRADELKAIVDSDGDGAPDATDAAPHDPAIQ